MSKTQEKIFEEAKRLFEIKGYYDTTVREITNAVGVNSGLFNYYFKNKYNLAVMMYDKLFLNVKSFTEEYFGDIENPAVFMGIMMRLHVYTINDDLAIKFTIDALKEGIFETAIIEKSRELVSNIDRFYNTGLSTEEQRILITITLGVERSIITRNNLGLFQTDTKTIADYVLRTHLFNFGLERKEIENCMTQVQENFQRLLNKKIDFVSMMLDY